MQRFEFLVRNRRRSQMVDTRGIQNPVISFRPVLRSDRQLLEKIHSDVFPIRYEPEFFENVVDGRDIISWAAVDCSRSDGLNDELIGFVTARIILSRDSEIEDLLRPSRSDQTLLYILTLGVIEEYRNKGIASSLIREVIKYASNLPTCQAVYLHVISYNNPAILLYKKMAFKCVRKLYDFYFINGRHYDAYLFVSYVNDGRSPCSPLEFVVDMVTYMRNAFKSLLGKVSQLEERFSKWPKHRDSSRCLVPTPIRRREITNEDPECECEYV